MNIVLLDKKEKAYKQALEYFSATKETTYNKIHETYKHKALKCHPDVYHHQVKKCAGSTDCVLELQQICKEGSKEMYTINGNMDVIRRYDREVESQTLEKEVPLLGDHMDAVGLDFEI